MATSARAAEEVGERMAKEKEAEAEGFRAKRKRVVREGTASTSSSKKKKERNTPSSSFWLSPRSPLLLLLLPCCRSLS